MVKCGFMPYFEGNSTKDFTMWFYDFNISTIKKAVFSHRPDIFALHATRNTLHASYSSFAAHILSPTLIPQRRNGKDISGVQYSAQLT